MDLRALVGLGLAPIEYLRDSLRMFKWSKASPFCPPSQQVHYDIMLLAHTVEKGLSVSAPRPGFGKEKIDSLLVLLDRYEENWPVFCVEKSYGCLKEYIEWHDSINYDLGLRKEPIDKFLRRCEEMGLNYNGGTKVISPSHEYASFEKALLGRHSSRQYMSDIVSKEVLNNIGTIAAQAPSQCNRQSARLHYYSDYEMIQKLLKLQGGAEGFRGSVHNLFVVSSELSAWSGFKARSQSYVDASLLAMQAMNALQSQGLAYCPLNLAVSNSREMEICRTGGISTGERLIMMISFGYPISSDFKVAKSARLSVEELIVVHK